jgi:6,7-dimethyl-8-ribityllumazine synthase
MTDKIGLVVAKYNREITEKMKENAVEKAQEKDAEVFEILEVPGSYDTPLAAQRLAEKQDVDAVTVMGAIITGETDHDKIIGNSTAKTLQEISLKTDTPVTMAITGPGMTAEQAYERISYAGDAVESALEMVEELN